MRAIREILFQRLSAQGLTQFEILRIVKDVLNLIGDGGDFTLPYVNQKLDGLGWKRGILDEVSFELILFLLENDNDYEVKRYNLH